MAKNVLIASLATLLILGAQRKNRITKKEKNVFGFDKGHKKERVSIIKNNDTIN
jgi:hypothetical protein